MKQIFPLNLLSVVTEAFSPRMGEDSHKKDEGGRCKSGLVALSSSSFYGIEPNKYDWRYLTIIKAIINFVLFTLGIHNN